LFSCQSTCSPEIESCDFLRRKFSARMYRNYCKYQPFHQTKTARDDRVALFKRTIEEALEAPEGAGLCVASPPPHVGLQVRRGFCL
jgi:hypothetical protein